MTAQSGRILPCGRLFDCGGAALQSCRSLRLQNVRRRQGLVGELRLVAYPRFRYELLPDPWTDFRVI